jgi:hypothetical protein
MRDAAMIEAAERAGVDAGRRPAGKSSAMCKAAMRDFPMRQSAGMGEPRMSATEVRVMVESRTVRQVSLMVVHHIVSVPVSSPVVPTPAKPAKDTNPNSQAERNPWAIDIETRNPEPPRVIGERGPVHDPRIVFGYVNNFRVRRCNCDRLTIRCDRFLLRAVQVPSLLRPLAHYLNRIEYILLPAHVCIAER